MSSTISKTETLGGETWQEMAARLGVEVRRKMIKRGDATFLKGDEGIQVGRHYLVNNPCILLYYAEDYGSDCAPMEAQEARDLSDCLQVAARYLEEVHG